MKGHIILMDSCIFCKIIQGEIPSDKVYEDEKILAFRDINPIAPVHILIIPKSCEPCHLDSLDSVTSKSAGDVTHILLKIPEIAHTLGLSNGYRVVVNTGGDGGQTVSHLHFHLLGGRPLKFEC